ncbi:hypothetical protein XANCAGTX0491_001497 [Xanthoria calcicola]
MMPSASSSTKRKKPNNKDNNNNHPKAANPPKHTAASTSKPVTKQAPTSHPSSTSNNSNTSTKNPNDSGGPATAAYKLAQMNIPPRQPTPHGSEAASSQACESADVSESERGVMRRERKDVMHQGPGGEFEVTRGGR